MIWTQNDPTFGWKYIFSDLAGILYLEQLLDFWKFCYFTQCQRYVSKEEKQVIQRWKFLKRKNKRFNARSVADKENNLLLNLEFFGTVLNVDLFLMLLLCFGKGITFPNLENTFSFYCCYLFCQTLETLNLKIWPLCYDIIAKKSLKNPKNLLKTCSRKQLEEKICLNFKNNIVWPPLVTRQGEIWIRKASVLRLFLDVLPYC